MYKLPSDGALRLAIAAVVGILAVLAVRSNGRTAKLDTWLDSPAARLPPSERQNLEEWINTTLIKSGVIREMHVNPAPRDVGLRLIVYRDEVPGVLSSETFNAAYDPTVDSIFIDRRLVFEDNGTLRDPGLLEFIILHELGHRALGHRAVSHFSSSRSSFFSLLRVPSTQEETAADSYAMEWLIRLRKTEAPGISTSMDEVVREIDALIEQSLLGNFLTGNSLGLEQSDATHPALLSRARTLLRSLSMRSDLSPSVLEGQRAYLDWIESALSNADRELSTELLAPDGTQFERATETPFGAAFLLSDGRVVFVRKEDLAYSRTRSERAIQSQPVGRPVPGIWPPQLNSGSAFWWANDGLYLLMPIGRLFFADSRSGWSWKQVSRLLLPTGITAVSLSHSPRSTNCPTLIFSGMNAVEVYRLLRYQSEHKIDLIAHFKEPPNNNANRFTFDFAGATSQKLYFWTNAGYRRSPSSQNVYELPVICSEGERVAPQRLDLKEIKSFRLYGIVPFPAGNGFLAIEIDVPNGQIIFRFLGTGQQPAMLTLLAHARPPGYQEVPSGFTYDFAGVDQAYFLPGGRFLALNVRAWGFYVLDVKERKFVLGGALNRVNLLSTPIAGGAGLATTLGDTTRVAVWSFEGRN